MREDGALTEGWPGRSLPARALTLGSPSEGWNPQARQNEHASPLVCANLRRLAFYLRWAVEVHDCLGLGLWLFWAVLGLIWGPLLFPQQ